MSDDVSGVPVGVTLSQQRLTWALPAATGGVSLPMPRKFPTHSSRTAVVVDLFPARPGAAGIGCRKAHATSGGLIDREDRDPSGNQRQGLRCQQRSSGISAAVHGGVNFKLVNDLLVGPLLPTSVLIPGQRPGRWRHG